MFRKNIELVFVKHIYYVFSNGGYVKQIKFFRVSIEKEIRQMIRRTLEFTAVNNFISFTILPPEHLIRHTKYADCLAYVL